MKKATQQKSRRTYHSYKSCRELTGLQQTEENGGDVVQIKQALLVWSGLMLETSPGFMGRLYRAVSEEWVKEVRGVLYEDCDLKDPRDRAFVALNSTVLDGLRKAQGQMRDSIMDSPGQRQRYDYALRWAAELFRSLADSADKELSQEVRMPKPYLPSYDDRNVVDFSCWRQSRPRPLKAREASDAEN